MQQPKSIQEYEKLCYVLQGSHLGFLTSLQILRYMDNKTNHLLAIKMQEMQRILQKALQEIK